MSKLVRDFLEVNSDKFDRVIFCLFTKKDIDLYSQHLQEYFPIPSDSASCQAVKTIVRPPELQQQTEPVLVLEENSDDL